MVDRSESLDSVFGSLSDSTRRDILRRVATEELSITDIAKPYHLTFAAISKHLKVLEKSGLIVKRRQGKEQMVKLAPKAIAQASEALATYQKLWEDRLDSLEDYLSALPK